MNGAALQTPVGPVSVEVDDASVQSVRLWGSSVPPAPAGAGQPGSELLRLAVAQLAEYFAGDRTSFHLPTSINPGSEFERAVWSELRLIPYGETRTYGQVAAAVGDPGAARAVGIACNRNPLPLLVPCHRVVGAGGKLVGFGAGLPAKRWLLEHEARVAMVRAWS